MISDQQLIVVVITGMSGAGRSTAAKVMEDLGFFVIDNLPSGLISQVVDISGDEARALRSRLALVVDSRSGAYSFDQLESEVLRLQGRGITTSIVFLDADDGALLRRFKESRRPHPVAADTLEESIAMERKLLEDLRGDADIVLDTTDSNIYELRDRLEEFFTTEMRQRPMRVSITSFGFKHGVPRDMDLLFDVRFLPNPHWVPELRPYTGKDAPVADYVFADPDAGAFLDKVADLLEFVIPRFEAEKKAYLAVGVGCTGGRHRSVALTEALRERLEAEGVTVTVRHRDTAR